MKCPVIDYHKNRNTKWWIKYILGMLLAFATGGMLIQWDDVDKWVNKSNTKEKEGQP